MKKLNLSLAFACLAIYMGQALGQQNSPDAVAEAAGAYLGAVYSLQAVKKTKCGYALLLDIGDFSQKAERDVRSNIPNAYKNELTNFIESVKHESQKIVANNIKNLEGKIDPRTQCGLVVGGLLGNLTQHWTEWERVKNRR